MVNLLLANIICQCQRLCIYGLYGTIQMLLLLLLLHSCSGLLSCIVAACYFNSSWL